MCRRTNARRALTLLELIIASTLLATLTVAISVVLRTSRQAWEAHEGDAIRLEALHATVRHIVRAARQANSVSEISLASDTSGRIGFLMSDGTTMVWDHDGATSQVNCGVTTPSGLLCNNITTLKFTGYKSDGTTATTTPTDVQNVLIEASVTLPRSTNATRSTSAWVWIRSW